MSLVSLIVDGVGLCRIFSSRQVRWGVDANLWILKLWMRERGPDNLSLLHENQFYMYQVMAYLRATTVLQTKPTPGTFLHTMLP